MITLTTWESGMLRKLSQAYCSAVIMYQNTKERPPHHFKAFDNAWMVKAQAGLRG